MKITSVYPTRTFKLILEFDMREYRMLNIKKFLKSDTGLLAEIRDDLDVFMSVKIDEVAGTVCWENGVDFDPDILYQESKDVDSIMDAI
ncbi:DUF2442 domain-containing protein [Ornithinibacillus halotolerans]|uniref:Molybdopterin-guanine dinucleotide biosynthesis protein MobA n=1 Tax=Ornithinibacillus halotolerans TaxID=1274357 RepID=A0A916W839_9BACI|nr:DUF2442 domain-containing protein [Ornithinibacillus halotolerans]GGA74299.1 molybdopterin-guanine dinucleotide biosynthesis protein MobA [Ornithinibacillus halotolerans]